jgi:hypothetical protein
MYVGFFFFGWAHYSSAIGIRQGLRLSSPDVYNGYLPLCCLLGFCWAGMHVRMNRKWFGKCEVSAVTSPKPNSRTHRLFLSTVYAHTFDIYQREREREELSDVGVLSFGIEL